MNKANSKKRKNGKVYNGKIKIVSSKEKAKIFNRYNVKLEEFKDFNEEQLTEILTSKLSNTDKSAAETLLNKLRHGKTTTETTK